MCISTHPSIFVAFSFISNVHAPSDVYLALISAAGRHFLVFEPFLLAADYEGKTYPTTCVLTCGINLGRSILPVADYDDKTFPRKENRPDFFDMKKPK